MIRANCAVLIDAYSPEAPSRCYLIWRCLSTIKPMESSNRSLGGGDDAR